MAKFKIVAILVNQYNEIVCELEKSDSGMYYKLPDDITKLLLLDGDEFRVKELEVEVE